MFSVSRYIGEYAGVVRSLDESAVEDMAQCLREAWEAGRTIFCCGNGGSAASASHFMMDLTKLSSPAEGPRIRALALTENLAAISAISNDVSYGEVFVEQLRPFLAARDVVIGFSACGSPANVMRALEFANANRAVTLGIVGLESRRLEELATRSLVVKARSVQQVEDATMVVVHLLCLRVRELIAGEASGRACEVRPANADSSEGRWLDRGGYLCRPRG